MRCTHLAVVSAAAAAVFATDRKIENELRARGLYKRWSRRTQTAQMMNNMQSNKGIENIGKEK